MTGSDSLGILSMFLRPSARQNAASRARAKKSLVRLGKNKILRYATAAIQYGSKAFD